MDKIRRALKYVLILPNGQYFGRFEELNKDVLCTGFFRNEFDYITLPSLKTREWGKRVWHTQINHIEILNELRTKRVDTFFLSENESKHLVVGSRMLLKQNRDTKNFKTKITFKSNGKGINIHLSSNSKIGLRNGDSNPQYKPIKTFSFQLDVHNIPYLRIDELTVRIGENGLISFLSPKYNEEIHIQSHNFSFDS